MRDSASSSGTAFFGLFYICMNRNDGFGKNSNAMQGKPTTRGIVFRKLRW